MEVRPDDSDPNDECIHGLGLVAACVLCNGKAAAEERTNNLVDYTFTAQYSGTVSCGCEVDEGDTLVRLRDSRVVCQGCAS